MAMVTVMETVTGTARNRTKILTLYLLVAALISQVLVHATSKPACAKHTSFVLPGDYVHPRVDKGNALRFLRHSDNHNIPNIEIVDLHTASVFHRILWFEGARSVDVTAIAASQGGGVIVSGFAVGDAGEAANYLAELDADGRVSHAIRTNPYLASDICVDGDGLIWSIGLVTKEGMPDTYRVLRKWDVNKGIIGALLPRRLFSNVVDNKETSLSQIFLGCGLKSVAVYSRPENLVVFVDTPTLSPTFCKLNPVDSSVEVLTGFAYSQNGLMFVGATAANRDGSRSGEVLRLIPARSSQMQWSKELRVPVAGNTAELCGIDGTEIVYCEQDRAHSTVTFRWFSTGAP
jgi:hypothetical protein